MASSEISERFCAPDADITISSSDGVLFKVHRKNLELHCDIFANAADTTRPETGEDIVHLSERAEVLDLLFQYMYRQPQPDLQVVEFSVFAGLAEAAEKYVVYSALTLCKMIMRNSIPQHPLEVLDYAVKHGHVEMADESARQSMGHGVADAMQVLAPDTFKTWTLVHERWQKKTALCLAELLGRREHYKDIVRESLQNPNGCYAVREELFQASSSYKNSVADMKFSISDSEKCAEKFRKIWD
ncbi:hypothetical protein C8R44DRAFT_758542 [Mycena epipterygia]|nr:hypothetical protein C8R44DRAFT_758542 [Mycena epipterygia]